MSWTIGLHYGFITIDHIILSTLSMWSRSIVESLSIELLELARGRCSSGEVVTVGAPRSVLSSVSSAACYILALTANVTCRSCSMANCRPYSISSCVIASVTT
eukprot:1360838-Amphidinium_carterae.1